MAHKQGDFAEVVALIERTAVEVANQEEQLRHKLVSLIQQGRTQEAVEILQAWDHMAPGDVLSKYGPVENGNQD